MCAIAVVAIGLLPAAEVAAGDVTASRADDVEQALSAAIESSLDQLAEDSDYEAAIERHTIIFDQTIAYVHESKRELFRDATWSLRLVKALSRVENTERGPHLEFLRANLDFARHLVFLMHEHYDTPDEVFTIVERLRTERGDKIEPFATLAAAIAVVHDRPMFMRINENTPVAEDPIALFDYFVTNEKKMLFGIRDVPAELLVYVVDSTARIEEMQWALERFEGDTNVGARFFDIEYDDDHLQKGTTKKVTELGLTLPNIQRYGGVCVDQAYFAASVGKAIGVPTAYTTGKSAEVGHAWVGFIQADRRRAWWNFDSGRQGAYQGVRGVVMSPQTRQPINDSHVSLLSAVVGSPVLDRQFTAACTDAARRMAELQAANEALAPPCPLGESSDPIREPVLKDRLAIVETALRRCPGYGPAWYVIRQAAKDGELTLAQKKRWSSVLHRLCGSHYPDFYWVIVSVMIVTVDDIEEQNRLWNVAFRNFSSRSDLAAAVRMAQATMWSQAGRSDRAGQCYEDVINRFTNAGPFVKAALIEAEKILVERGEQDKVLDLYRKAWSLTERPGFGGAYATQSNWYQIGVNLIMRLKRAGLEAEASDVEYKITGRRSRR